MRPYLTSKESKPKSLQYEQFRNAARTEFKCNSSSLLPDLNELDEQVKHYQQLRTKKLSQSQLQNLNLKEISNLEQSGIQKSHRLFIHKLQTIDEYQPNRHPVRAKTNLLNSSVVSSTKQKANEKPVQAKKINGKTKQQVSKRQKMQVLRAKTKSLRTEFLSMLGNDSAKKNFINKQFTLILKMLQ